MALNRADDRLVSVVVDVPRLELDRPFTYRVPGGADADLGDVVSVPFHGRTVRGWVLGAADEVPDRVLPLRRVLSGRPVFDRPTLELCRWVAERYVAPLATVIGRAHPPRVASEEERDAEAPPPAPSVRPPAALGSYRGGPDLLRRCRAGTGAFVVRPLPDDEASACVEAVAACVAGGRDALVLVPEADPLPATARAVMEAFAPAAVLFAGGDARSRYRSWLDLLGSRHRVVVGTRPAAFAPLRRTGLVWVHRESHPGHREERSPYHHVREVARARARLQGAVCVLSALGPSADATALADRGEAALVRATRARERTAAPLVELARPEAEDRSPRLASLLRSSTTAFLLLSRRGYGVARTCRTCGEPARCERCGGPISLRGGATRCAVCGGEGRCATCGGTAFGVERGGTERIEEWAGRLTRRPVVRVDEGAAATRPPSGGVVVGTAAAVKDFGPLRVDLVAVLDPDAGRRRPGLSAPDQVLATWFEAATWAGPRGAGGRVLVQTREPGDPAVQALIRWDPWHFQRSERARREEAGFPPGFPVFRVRGSAALPAALQELRPVTLLATASADETICLVTLRPDALTRFGGLMRSLAERGTVVRVEAEPQL